MSLLEFLFREIIESHKTIFIPINLVENINSPVDISNLSALFVLLKKAHQVSEYFQRPISQLNYQQKSDIMDRLESSLSEGQKKNYQYVLPILKELFHFASMNVIRSLTKNKKLYMYTIYIGKSPHLHVNLHSMSPISKQFQSNSNSNSNNLMYKLFCRLGLLHYLILNSQHPVFRQLRVHSYISHLQSQSKSDQFRSEFNLHLYLSPLKKKFPPPILNQNIIFIPDMLNSAVNISGTIYHPSITTIFRKEELLKTIIHELIHHWKLDTQIHNDSYHQLESYLAVKNHNDNILFGEAWVESLATIFHCGFTAAERKQTPSQATKYLKMQNDFAWWQSSKILYLSNKMTLMDLYRVNAKKYIEETTAATSYHILKSILIEESNIFLIKLYQFSELKKIILKYRNQRYKISKKIHHEIATYQKLLERGRVKWNKKEVLYSSRMTLSL